MAFISILMLALLAGAVVEGKAIAREKKIPCADIRGCPDLSVDDVELLITQREQKVAVPEDECAVQEGMVEPGNRTLLRFSTKIPNLGDGDLRLGDPADKTNKKFFSWHECHGHYHFDDYADHRLWDLEGFDDWNDARSAEPEKSSSQVLEENPELKEHLVAGSKLGFCLLDLERPDPYEQPGATYTEPRKFLDCENQGISREWADVYSSQIVGQWIDVTDLSPGVYVLEVEVNPGRTIIETDYADNRGSAYVFVGTAGTVPGLPPGIGPGPITIPPDL